MKAYIISAIRLICSDCNAILDVQTSSKRKAIEYARSLGWGAAQPQKDKERKCYCPACAPFHKHVGCKGGTRAGIQTRLNLG